MGTVTGRQDTDGALTEEECVEHTGEERRPMRIVTAVVLLVLVSPAWSVINPNFTPADLVTGATRILLLRISAPEGRKLVAEVKKTLKGTPFPRNDLTFEVPEGGELAVEDVAAAFRAGPATAVLVLSKQNGADSRNAVSGALQVETQWFAVSHKDGSWQLGQDKQQLFAVWAGSARLLGEATRYVLADPVAEFPVRSDLSWCGEWNLGTITGRLAGCLLADFGAPLGTCAVVLSDAGDHVYQLKRDGGRPRDITQSLALTTRSHVSAFGDFDGDGRVDMASWNGNRLDVALQTREGVFVTRPLGVELPGCRSIQSINIGAKAAAGLLAGTRRGPVILFSDGTGDFAVRSVTGAVSGDGTGGLVTAADVDDDGWCDVLQIFAGAMTLYGGTGPGQFAEPVRIQVPVVKNPSHVVFGDYDRDGRLDFVVTGDEGFALLSRTPDGHWENLTHVTGELTYHGNANRPAVVGAVPCDVNNDGRQGVALFYAAQKPMLFFNRGFACFGLARELDLARSGSVTSEPLDPFGATDSQEPLKATGALQFGQTAGTVLDLNGDDAQDLLAVNGKGEVWALLGELTERPPLVMAVSLSPRICGPVTLTVRNTDGLLGMHVVRPGEPAFVGVPEPSPLVLQWIGSGRKKHQAEIIVEESCRVELNLAGTCEVETMQQKR